MRGPSVALGMLLAASIGVSLTFAEAVARRLRPLGLDSSTEHRIPHPVFGWVLEPGASYHNDVGETTVQVEYNSQGWRDVEHVHHPDDRIRAVVLGDSFMEAYSVSLDESFPQRLEEDAAARGVDLELEAINLGVGGYGTLQEYLVIRELGPVYRPDIVLLAFHIANDVRNNSLELESVLHPGSMKLDSRPFLDPEQPESWKITVVDFEGARRRYVRARTELDAPLARLSRHSALLRMLLQVGHEALDFGRDEPEVWRGRRNSAARFMAQYGWSFCEEPAEYRRAWSITERILARLRDEVRALGSRFVLFNVPAVEEIDASWRERVEDEAPAPSMLCLERAPGTARLAELAERLGIEYVDLLAAFREASRSGGLVFYNDADRHWNAEGHALAATRVGAYLWEFTKSCDRNDASDPQQQIGGVDQDPR